MAILGAMTATDDTQEHPIVRAEAPSLEALYSAHATALARVLRAAGLPDATDAVQEAFVQAVVHWRKVARRLWASVGRTGRLTAVFGFG